MNRSRKKFALGALLVAGALTLHFAGWVRNSAAKARTLSADYLGVWTNLSSYAGIRFTPFMEYHLSGRPPGLKPGWIVSIDRNTGGHMCDIYVDMSGGFLGNDNPASMALVTKAYRERLARRQAASAGDGTAHEASSAPAMTNNVLGGD